MVSSPKESPPKSDCGISSSSLILVRYLLPLQDIPELRRAGRTVPLRFHIRVREYANTTFPLAYHVQAPEIGLMTSGIAAGTLVIAVHPSQIGDRFLKREPSLLRELIVN